MCTLLTVNVYERVVEIFLVSIDLELPVDLFQLLQKNAWLKQDEKNPEHNFYRHWSVGKAHKILAKNIKLYGSHSLSKFSIFQTNDAVSRLCLNVYMRFCIT